MLRRSPQLFAPLAFLHQSSYVNGEFISKGDGGEPLTVKDPSNGDVLGTVPNCSKAQVKDTIACAAEAQEKWAGLLARQRALIVRKWGDLIMQNTKPLAELLSLESGKPMGEALQENAYSAQFAEWYSCEAERICGDVLQPFRAGVRPVVYKRPVGVVGIITPWNFPSAMITRSAAGALAAGCSVVLKPSELTPFSALALAELAEQAGVPRGVFNVVTGDAKPVGEALTESDTVRKLCFTGSTRTGKVLMRACVDTVKKVSMELGGNAPFIIFPDADLDLAVAGAMACKFRNSGQTCICANRFFVHETIQDEFTEKLINAVKKLKVGQGIKEGVNMGPVITRSSADRLRGVVEAASKAGNEIITPNNLELSSAEEKEGRFVTPTIVRGVKHCDPCVSDELFGPVLPIMSFSTTDEVIHKANDTTAGLAAYIYTSDYKKQWTVPERLQYGMVGVNEGAISSPIAPFGGVKESGLGRDGSKYGIEAFVDICYHLHGGNIA